MWAISGVLNRHSGNRRDLYGSNVRTPVSPRPMEYAILFDFDRLGISTTIIFDARDREKLYKSKGFDTTNLTIVVKLWQSNDVAEARKGHKLSTSSKDSV